MEHNINTVFEATKFINSSDRTSTNPVIKKAYEFAKKCAEIDKAADKQSAYIDLLCNKEFHDKWFFQIIKQRCLEDLKGKTATILDQNALEFIISRCKQTRSADEAKYLETILKASLEFKKDTTESRGKLKDAFSLKEGSNNADAKLKFVGHAEYDQIFKDFEELTDYGKNKIIIEKLDKIFGLNCYNKDNQLNGVGISEGNQKFYLSINHSNDNSINSIDINFNGEGSKNDYTITHCQE